MSDWKPYSVQANFGGMDLLVSACTRSYDWRIGKHPTPGTKGDRTSHHGRNSIMDSVSVLLTVPEVKKLEALGDSKRARTWTHPLLKQIEARMENLQIPATRNLQGYFAATFNLVEHRVPNTINLGTISAGSAKKKASSIFDNLSLNLDGLDAGMPAASGAAFGGAWGDFGDAFGGLEDTFDALDEGDAIWRDLSRSLDVVTDAADSLIDVVQDVADDMGSIAYDAIEGVSTVVQTARDAVNAVQSVAEDAVTFVTQAPSDLLGMMAEAGMDITEDAISLLMESNGIEDPFAILPNTTITLPRIAA